MSGPDLTIWEGKLVKVHAVRLENGAAINR